MNIFSSITSFLKNHVWCLVVYLSTVTLVVWGADGDLANRAGFAASIVSIVLAIVVIVFTMQESNRVQRLLEQFGQTSEKNQEVILGILNSGSGATSQQPAEKSPERQNQGKILKYYLAKGLRFSDTTDKTNAMIYSLGAPLSFDLFNGPSSFKFHGYFSAQEQNEILFNVKQLMKTIGDAYNRADALKDNSEAFQKAIEILNAISIDVLVADNLPKEIMDQKVAEFQPAHRNITVNFISLDSIETYLEKEYASLDVS